MSNRNFLFSTNTKELLKAFLPNIFVKLEYESNICPESHNYREIHSDLRRSPIVPIFSSVQSGYTMPIVH